MTTSLLQELDQAIQGGSAESRERALWHATDLLMVGQFSDDDIWVFGEVIGKLATEIEMAARAKLATKLSRIDHAPVQVINRMASDPAVEVAGPVLQHSQRLDVRTLVQSASTGGQQHLLAIARRRSVPEPVTDVLVVRGNREVVHEVAGNAGAKFTEAGFLSLIQRSENDSILAEHLGQRRDIPRRLFQQLIAKAADETRKKLERERPDMIGAVDTLVADVTASLHSKFGPASPRYFEAKKIVTSQHRYGNLTEKSVRQYAGGRKNEETIVALTLLCALPSDVVERALFGANRELLLILAKAQKFSWETTLSLLFLGATDFRISSQELAQLEGQFDRLGVINSKEVIARYRDRKSAAATAQPAR